MSDFELHYELKGRMSAEGKWYVIGYSSTKDSLDEMIERHKSTWKYLAWNSYRAAKRLK